MITTNRKVNRPGSARPARTDQHSTSPARSRPASSRLARSSPADTGPASPGQPSSGAVSSGPASPWPAGTSPGSTEEAIAAVTAGLQYLARVDAPALGAAGQARCLRALEAAESMHTAARVNILAAFSSGLGYTGDGCGSARSWLVWQTQVTRSAAAGAHAWLVRS
ncbi:MAG TPA: hypothetical protein VGH27_32595, partial [Streptosporangiaceae bacterium]